MVKGQVGRVPGVNDGLLDGLDGGPGGVKQGRVLGCALVVVDDGVESIGPGHDGADVVTDRGVVASDKRRRRQSGRGKDEELHGFGPTLRS